MEGYVNNMPYRHYKRNLIVFTILLTIIVLWIILITSIPPKEIVNSIGVNNSYLLIFIVASLGGVSSLTSTTFYTAYVTVIAGGVNIYIAGVVAGIGVSIGDSLFYFLGRKGNKIIHSNTKKYIDKVSRRLENKPYYIVFSFIFFYAGFTPFPNDILTLSLGITRQSYRRIIVPLLLGNLVSLILIGIILTTDFTFLFK